MGLSSAMASQVVKLPQKVVIVDTKDAATAPCLPHYKDSNGTLMEVREWGVAMANNDIAYCIPPETGKWYKDSARTWFEAPKEGVICWRTKDSRRGMKCIDSNARRVPVPSGIQRGSSRQ